MQPIFRDRRDAGLLLAEELKQRAGDPNLLVLALPRGGVPIAAVIAHRLQAPLDVFVVRKLGVPGHEELAMGAIARGGVRVLNDDIIRKLHIPPSEIESAARTELVELERREETYRGHHRALNISGKTVIMVDDGLATGATMRAAVAAVRAMGAARVIAAVPVGSWEACEALSPLVDELVCLSTPEPFVAIGIYYEEFPQLSDDDVRHLLNPPLKKAQHA